VGYIYLPIVLVVSPSTPILLFKAPHRTACTACPSSDASKHKSFRPALVSAMLNKVASHASQTCFDWWSLNGWSSNNIVHFSIAIMVLCLSLSSFIFVSLRGCSCGAPGSTAPCACAVLHRLPAPPLASLRGGADRILPHRHGAQCVHLRIVDEHPWKQLALPQGSLHCHLLHRSSLECLPVRRPDHPMRAVGTLIFVHLTLDEPAFDSTGSLGAPPRSWRSTSTTCLWST